MARPGGLRNDPAPPLAITEPFRQASSPSQKGARGSYPHHAYSRWRSSSTDRRSKSPRVTRCEGLVAGEFPGPLTLAYPHAPGTFPRSPYPPSICLLSPASIDSESPWAWTIFPGFLVDDNHTLATGAAKKWVILFSIVSVTTASPPLARATLRLPSKPDTWFGLSSPAYSRLSGGGEDENTGIGCQVV